MRAARWPVLVWVVCFVGALWVTVTGLSVHSDLSDLLPEGTTNTQRLLLTQVRSGLAGRLILVAIEGAHPDELARLSRGLSDGLQGNVHVDFVGNGAQELSSDEQQLLFRLRYLLSSTLQADTFSADSLRGALERRLDDLRSPLGFLVKEFIPSDPTGEFMGILQSWSEWEAPTKHRQVWMSADLRRALLVVQTKAAGFDAEAQTAIQQHIRTVFEQIRGDSPSVRMLLSGPGVFAVEIQHTIEGEIRWLSVAAALMVCLFLYVTYRSLILLALSLIPLTSGILAGLVAVNSSFGFVHGITLGFGITLLGVVDDYPIHLFSHLTRKESAPATMRAIWPTMRLGIVTTAIGFSSLLLAGFPALAQLGLFAVAGLGTAAVVTRWVLPVCIPAGFVPREVRPDLGRLIDSLPKARIVAPVAVILATIVLIWSDTPLWQEDLESLSPLSADKKELDQQLRQELGAPDVRDLVVVEGTTVEALLMKAEAMMPRLERLREGRVLSGYDMVSRYLPSHHAQQERLKALPDREALERNLDAAQKGLPFMPGLFTPFVTAVDEARRQLPIDRNTFKGTAFGMKLDSLLFSQHDQWLAIVPLRGVLDRRQLATAVADWEDASVSYVDLKEESNRLMRAYRNRMMQLVGWGTIAITVSLAVGLGSIRRLGPVLAPIGCAVIVVAAILKGSGESLSLFHVATFLLVIGLGLDYSLFFNRQEGTEIERAKTVFGLLVCSTTTILVFGLLAFSKIPVLHAIGLTAACGSFFCLLFSGLMAQREDSGA
jgi:predicted exporter